MKRNITLKDIARELDVSVSTVSKALKNSEEIGGDTRKRIQAFAKLYNYRPNNIALSLRSKRTRTIGVILPDVVHHFFTTVFRGIEQYANENGYRVIVCVSDESLEREKLNIEMMVNGSVEGVIMALSAETQFKNEFSHLQEITALGIPLVLFDRVTDKVACDKVVTNDTQAAYLAVKHFIDAGRRRIALVTTERFLNVSERREEGYYEALKDHSIPIEEELVLRLPYRYEEEVLSRTFFDTQKFEAVLCVNEIFAIRCMNLATERGLRIPDDIAFIGFTDGILSRLSNPTLSVVAQHGERMGTLAAGMLIDKLEDTTGLESGYFKAEIIEATLIERESSPKLI